MANIKLFKDIVLRAAIAILYDASLISSLSVSRQMAMCERYVSTSVYMYIITSMLSDKSATGLLPIAESIHQTIHPIRQPLLSRA